MPKLTFRPYRPTDRETCLELFDANCPEFFATNEREDYDDFLIANSASYELCCGKKVVFGAFGLTGRDAHHRTLNWILLNPASHGLGIGTTIMERILTKAHEFSVPLIIIAASHKSAPFFAKFGASEITVTSNGWGPGMHRIDMELRL